MNESALAKKDPMGCALESFDAKRYNLCAPVTAIDRIPDMHRISVRVVQVNPDTETYPIPGQSDKVGIGKVALDKIASAANIQWIPNQCGRIDDRKDPYMVSYRAVGVMKNFDGETRVISAEKTLDFRGKAGEPEDSMGADTQEIVRIAAKKGRDPWPQIAQCRQQIHSLAESKAKNRAIRAALAIPVAMLRADVGKPFVIPALVLQPDMSDPDVKAAAIRKMFGDSAALYGAPQTSNLRAIGPAPVQAEMEGVIIDADPETGEVHEEDDITAAGFPPPATEPWDMPKPKRFMLTTDELAATGEKSGWFKRLNELCQAVYDRFGQDVGTDHLAATFPKDWDPATSPATLPATEVAKIGSALKALVGR